MDIQGNNICLRGMRILLFGQRERRILGRVLDRVPREGPNHKRVVVGRRRT
jgi:hypothetical protein